MLLIAITTTAAAVDLKSVQAADTPLRSKKTGENFRGMSNNRARHNGPHTPRVQINRSRRCKQHRSPGDNSPPNCRVRASEAIKQLADQALWITASPVGGTPPRRVVNRCNLDRARPGAQAECPL